MDALWYLVGETSCLQHCLLEMSVNGYCQLHKAETALGKNKTTQPCMVIRCVFCNKKNNLLLRLLQFFAQVISHQYA